MAITLKSAWEEAKDWLSDQSKNVAKTFKPVAAKARNFYQDFTNDYNNFQQSQIARRERNSRQAENFVKNVLKTPTNRVKNTVNYFKTPTYTPGQQPKPSIWNNPWLTDVQKTVPSMKKQSKATAQLTGGSLLKLVDDIAKGNKLRLKPQGRVFDSMLKQSQDMSLPQWQRDLSKSQLAAYEGYEKIADENNLVRKGYEKLLSEGLDTSDELQRLNQENLRDLPGDTVWEQMRNPEWWSRGMMLTLPNMLGQYGLTIAVGALTKNPQLTASVLMTSGYSMNAGEMYANAKQGGLSEEEAQGLSRTYGIFGSILDRLGMGPVLDRMPGGSKVKSAITKSILLSMTESFGTEATTETLQQLLQNSLLRYKDVDIPIFSGLVESFVFGGIAGAAGGGGQTMVTRSLSPQKPGAVAGIQSTSQQDAWNDGHTIEKELNDYLEKPEGDEWEHDIQPVVGEDGKLMLQRNSFNLETQEQNNNVKPIEFLYKAVDSQELKDILKNGAIDPNRALFRHNDPSLLLSKEGGFVLKIAADKINNLRLDDSGEFITTDDSVALEDVISINNELLDGSQVAIGQDLDQALSDTGQEIVDREATETGPVDDKLTGQEAQAAIRSMFSDKEIEFITGSAKDITDEAGNMVHGKYYDSVISVVEVLVTMVVVVVNGFSTTVRINVSLDCSIPASETINVILGEEAKL